MLDDLCFVPVYLSTSKALKKCVKFLHDRDRELTLLSMDQNVRVVLSCTVTFNDGFRLANRSSLQQIKFLFYPILPFEVLFILIQNDKYVFSYVEIKYRCRFNLCPNIQSECLLRA